MSKIDVEVVLALEKQQFLKRITVDEGTTVEQVISLTEFADLFPEYFTAACQFGIYGKKVLPDTLLKAEDRVEIYRPLKVDPKQNRHLKILNKKRSTSD